MRQQDAEIISNLATFDGPDVKISADYNGERFACPKAAILARVLGYEICRARQGVDVSDPAIFIGGINHASSVTMVYPNWLIHPGVAEIPGGICRRPDTPGDMNIRTGRPSAWMAASPWEDAE